MANPNTQVAQIRAEVAEVLRHIEQAQATAAAAVQRWNALGGSASITGATFDGSDIAAADVESALYSLSSALPGLLGNHATNLYKVRG